MHVDALPPQHDRDMTGHPRINTYIEVRYCLKSIIVIPVFIPVSNCRISLQAFWPKPWNNKTPHGWFLIFKKRRKTRRDVVEQFPGSGSYHIREAAIISQIPLKKKAVRKQDFLPEESPAGPLETILSHSLMNLSQPGTNRARPRQERPSAGASNSLDHHRNTHMQTSTQIIQALTRNSHVSKGGL